MFLAAALAAGHMAGAAPAQAAGSAVVLMYHRFGESAYPAASIRLDQFEAHIAELASGRYHVLPLPDIVAALRRGDAVPDLTVALTIDDAHASAYAEAWPRLRRAGLPFTLFVATAAIDGGGRGTMSWDQIRELAAAGVTIGAHSASHPHMAGAAKAANRAEIERSNARFRAELGRVPGLFAYPYGEAGPPVQSLVREAGYIAAFGQQSGVLHRRSDLYYLPRFAMNEHYGALRRFRLVIRALPLPVGALTPADPVIDPRHNPPAIGFAVAPELAPLLDRMTCYSSHEGAMRIARNGERGVALQAGRPFPPGLGRVNCTLPGPEGRWRWFGMQFSIREPERR